MKPKFACLPLMISSLVMMATPPASAQTAVELCNSGGVCSELPPDVAAAYVILDLLIKELSKPHPFGENNDIVRAINELNKFISDGMGPTNDIRQFLEKSGIDHLLQQLGIHLF